MLVNHGLPCSEFQLLVDKIEAAGRRGLTGLVRLLEGVYHVKFLETSGDMETKFQCCRHT